MIEDVIKEIEAAELILIGIGEELDSFYNIEKKPSYVEAISKISEDSAWTIPFVKKMIQGSIKNEKSGIYDGLANLLRGKNYFIVSLCQDGLLRESNLDKERIVEPCGSYDRLQCSKKCSTELYPVSDNTMKQMKEIWESRQASERPKELYCPNCGSAMEFNNINAANYVEEGYLEKWSRYKKWLQGTVNKRLCVIELGVGMKYPTVIRWPFEKVVYFNQKAEMFRIHDRLYQVPEEIKDRAYGICQRPDGFLTELDAK